MDGRGEEDPDQPIATLPRELLSYVFSLLDITERSFASHVCRRWRAAALEPPHSTTLSLRLLHEWAVDEDWIDGEMRTWWPEEACAADPTALTEAEMRLALGSPLARGVTTLRVALGRAASASPAAAQDADGGVRLVGIRRWPVRALLEALPASVTSLEVRHSDVINPSEDGYAFERDVLFQQFDAVQECAPQLRELTLRNIIWLTNREASRWVPNHAGLERLDADTLELTDRTLFDDMPSLRRIASRVSFRWPLQLGPEDVRRTLAALAERGLRVRSLSLLNEDLAYEGMVEALSAIFDPAAVGPGSGPAGLWLNFDRLPDGGLPESFGAGAEQIECHGSPLRSILPWLTAMSRGPRLRLLELWIEPKRRFGIIQRSPDGTRLPDDMAMPELGFSFRELVAALQGCRDGLRIKLVCSDVWPTEFAGAWALVMEDRDLLRALAVDIQGSFHSYEGNAAVDAAVAAYWHYRTERVEALAERGGLDRAERLRALSLASDIHARALVELDRIGRPRPAPIPVTWAPSVQRLASRRARRASDLGPAPTYGEMLRRVLACVPVGEDAEVDRARARLLARLDRRVYVSS